MGIAIEEANGRMAVGLVTSRNHNDHAQERDDNTLQTN
jgi:hypothetical protein